MIYICEEIYFFFAKDESDKWLIGNLVAYLYAVLSASIKGNICLTSPRHMCSIMSAAHRCSECLFLASPGVRAFVDCVDGGWRPSRLRLAICLWRMRFAAALTCSLISIHCFRSRTIYYTVCSTTTGHL